MLVNAAEVNFLYAHFIFRLTACLSVPFPGSRPNAREPSPDAASRAHSKSHTAHKIPIPRRVSGGRESVVCTSLTSYHNRTTKLSVNVGHSIEDILAISF